MNWMLFSGFVCAFLACILHIKGAYKWSLAAVCAGAFMLRLYAAHLDPFLHDWDEKFHALVARNFMDDPLLPVLKKGIVIPYDYKAWCCNEIWVHKQPLFMWQMAASMKLFGISEFAVRYPSVLMGALMVPMIYGIARRLTDNRHIAFGSALLLCFCNYHLELISGYHGMDHNDTAFGFYVLASIWAYSEYLHSSKRMKWALLIGLFAGCAILNKWLTGLLVYSAWGINVLIMMRSKEAGKEIINILCSVAMCVLVFLPWQLYIHYRFPVEAAHEMEYNTRHVFEMVEGHGGSTWFYLGRFAEYFGAYVWLVVPVGLLVAIITPKYLLKNKILIIAPIVIVFCFFSLIVQTKITSYFFVVAPLCYILIAIALNFLVKITRLPTFIFLPLIVIACFYTFDHQLMMQRRDPSDGRRSTLIYNTGIYKELGGYLPDSIRTVTNLGDMEDIKCMFYNPGITAYHYDFSETEMEIIKQKNIPVGAFQDHDMYVVPHHVLSYPKTYIIKLQLK